jgi:hypothetical protein
MCKVHERYNGYFGTKFMKNKKKYVFYPDKTIGDASLIKTYKLLLSDTFKNISNETISQYCLHNKVIQL